MYSFRQKKKTIIVLKQAASMAEVKSNLKMIDKLHRIIWGDLFTA